MGSPVSPPVANLFMADLESKALRSFSGAPSVWYRYVDDVLSIVKRSLVKDFLDHLNSQHGGFTVEVDKEGRLPFMDVLLQRRENGMISTEVYRKPTHTERYLRFDSHHLLGAKKAVFGALARRLNYVSQEEDKERELEHIKSVLMENGYPRALVEAWSRQKKGTIKGEEQDDVVGTVCLPYVKGLSEAIARILRKVRIRVVSKPETGSGA